MEPGRHRKPPGLPGRRILAAALAGVVLVACGYGAGRWHRTQEAISVTVTSSAGSRTVELHRDADVAAALRRAGVTPKAGPLKAVVSGRVLQADYAAPVILVDDRSATPGTGLADGAEVEVTDGTDTVESTVTAEGPGGAAPPVTEVMTIVMTPGTPDRALLTRGERSGEVVSQVGVVGPVAPAPRTDKVVALTFDDGPGPIDNSTELILDILRDKGVKAVFCPIGVHVPGRPDLMKREVDEGHLLCNHTLNHDQHLGTKPQERVDEQMDGGNREIVAATGVYPQFYRPPAGSVSPTVIAEANARGQQVLKWTVESGDYTKPGVDTIVRRTTTDIPNGAILLFHDGGGDRSQTVAALPLVIDRLREQGFTFVLPQSTLVPATPPPAEPPPAAPVPAPPPVALAGPPPGGQ